MEGGAVEGGAVDHLPPADNNAAQHLRMGAVGCGSWATGEAASSLAAKGGSGSCGATRFGNF